MCLFRSEAVSSGTFRNFNSPIGCRMTRNRVYATSIARYEIIFYDWASSNMLMSIKRSTATVHIRQKLNNSKIQVNGENSKTVCFVWENMKISLRITKQTLQWTKRHWNVMKSSVFLEFLSTHFQNNDQTLLKYLSQVMFYFVYNTFTTALYRQYYNMRDWQTGENTERSAVSIAFWSTSG